MKTYDKNLKAHKMINRLFLIILIPFLLLSILSITIMINAKNAGGYANIFGYYVIELKNDNFYDSTTGEYKSGTKQFFKATSAENITEGDIIAYYSDTPKKVIEGEEWVWQDFSTTLSSNTTNTNLTNYEDSTQTSSQITIVKVGPQKAIYNNEYVGFTYYQQQNGELVADLNSLVLAQDVIGVAIPTNAIIANVIDYAKTTESLLLFVLLPCMLLVLIKFISLAFYQKYENTNQIARKGQIIDSEQTPQRQGVYTTIHAPQRPTRISSVRQTPIPRTPPSIPRNPTHIQRTPPTRPPQRPTRSN